MTFPTHNVIITPQRRSLVSILVIMKSNSKSRQQLTHIATTLLFLASISLTALTYPIAPVKADTAVGGVINEDTTWTKVNSPYIVTNNVLVSSGVTLTIDPGVTVKFNSAKGLQIEGQLIAQGTESEPIVFTSNQPSPAPGDWVNILFTDTSVDATYDGSGNYINGSIMRYCTMEYGGGSSAPMLKILSSSPFIDHCSVTHSARGGIYADNSSSKISSSTISNNSACSGGGISASGTVAINNCTISNNSASCLYAGGGICAFGGTVTINNCTISGNSASGGYGGGIYAGGLTVTINNCTISNNSAGRGSGIYTEYSTMIINSSTISNN